MTLEHSLSTLETSGLIRSVQLDFDLEYLFRHALVQEATYESILKTDRRILHRAVAETLERLYPEQLDALAFLLGQHWQVAGEADQACHYFTRAGNLARQIYANSEAITAYTYALTVATDPATQVDLYLYRGQVLELVGRWPEAESDYREALAMSLKLADALSVAECKRRLGLLARGRGDFVTALDWLRQAQTVYETLGESSKHGQVLNDMGGVFYLQGDYELAREQNEASLAIAHERDDSHLLAETFHYLGAIAQAQGEFGEARRYYEESLSIRRALNDKFGIAALLNNLGVVAQECGEYATAKEFYEASLALERETGRMARIASALTNLGLLAQVQGDYARAYEHYTEGLEMARMMGDKGHITNILENYGNAAIEQQDYRAARAAYVESLALAHEAGNRLYVAYNLNGLAAVSLGMGHARRAAKLAAAAEKMRTALNFTWEMCEQRIYERTLKLTRAGLSADDFSAAWVEGERLMMEEAVEYALNLGA